MAKKKYSFKIIKSEAQDFGQPVQQIVLMLISLVLVFVGAYLMFPSVAPIFLSSPYLNGVILAVFIFGSMFGFWGVFFSIPLATFIKAVWNSWPGSSLNET